MILPAGFQQRITAAWGKRGTVWLEELPGVLDTCLERWSLTLEAPLPGSRWHYLAGVRTPADRDAVLKLGVPDRELTAEIQYLRAAGVGQVVELLASDPDLGALLLERISPGTPLSAEEDDLESTRIGARMIQETLRSGTADPIFPALSDWVRAFSRLRERNGGGTDPLPPRVVARAEAFFSALSGSSPEPRLLHGDLHHDNILQRGTDHWAVIDPQGVIGDPAYEAARFQHNPVLAVLSWERPAEIIGQRLRILEETLGYDRQRLLGWAYVDAVLSACWSLEDGAGDWKTMLAWIKAYEELLA